MALRGRTYARFTHITIEGNKPYKKENYIMKFVEFDLAKKNELIGSFSGHVQDDAVKEALETLNSKKTQLMLKLKGIRILNIKVK